MPAFDQEGDDPRQFAKDVIPVDRALEVLLATAAAGAEPPPCSTMVTVFLV